MGGDSDKFKDIQEKLPEFFCQVSETEPSPCKILLFVFPQCRKNSGELKILSRLKSKVPICLWLELCTMICRGASLRSVIRGVTMRGKGSYQAPSQLRDYSRKGCPKSAVLR